jgi:hypothetical protein
MLIRTGFLLRKGAGMLPSNQRQDPNASDMLANFKPGMLFVIIILGALLAFEVFNYSTTDHALNDLLGDLTFIGIPWSTILAIAFCGIDFAGIARLFTPEQGLDEPKEVWYLFGAWLLAATMNAILTWWGVSMAVASHPVKSSSVVDPATITSVVPVFVAVMVWVIRILIIGTLSLALDRMLHPGIEQHLPLQNVMNTRNTRQQQVQSSRPMSIPQSMGSTVIPSRPASSLPRAAQAQASPRRDSRFSSPAEDADPIYDPSNFGRPEPTYHSLNGTPRPNVNNPPNNTNNRNNGNDHWKRT